jgi:hypothetical protein
MTSPTQNDRETAHQRFEGDMLRPDQGSEVTHQHESFAQPHGNDEFPWDDFNSEWYVQHNYRRLRDDDSQILRLLAEFFGNIGHREPKHGIDVGTGANLYPALAMLPLCGRITLRERSATNCEWLRREINSYSDTWDSYWNELARWPRHSALTDPRWAVSERARVECGSVFSLGQAVYDVGTMFFVAESITERRDEFERATHCFLRSLRPNAPFAAAFMRESQGYAVAGVHFSAVAITEHDVQECLRSAGVRKSHVETIVSATPLRKSAAMMFVTGWTGRRQQHRTATR